MTRTTVVNRRNASEDVYIGRGSKWGNPFKIGQDGSREEVIAKYREYLWQSPHLLDSLLELEGKKLGCFCKPHACHGDVLVRAVQWARARAVEQPRVD